jgi:hypothetical protein
MIYVMSFKVLSHFLSAVCYESYKIEVVIDIEMIWLTQKYRYPFRTEVQKILFILNWKIFTPYE